jgi:N-dimethylarginine dimethylaminohydrolase
MPRKPHILMCPPTNFGVEYEINPWMDRRIEVDHDRAVSQWTGLHELLSRLGAKISLLDPLPDMPDFVFTANAGLVFGNDIYLARFRHSQRQVETPHLRRWFDEQGFHVIELPSDLYFEGAGDALFCGETLFAGYRIRSDVQAHQWVGGKVSRRVIPLELVDPSFYHLDTCFCPLGPDTAIYYPGAFDDYARRAIGEVVEDLIEIDREEAVLFACNSVVIGRSVVTNVGCPRLHDDLRQRGFEPIETPVDEFIKAGGGAKCLTLRLDGEDAATWPMSQTDA